MSHPLISRAMRMVALTAAGGTVFFALVAPFSAGPSALADPKPKPPPAHTYNVSLSSTTSTQLDVASCYVQSIWKWYQGGANGTVLASGSLDENCPAASGTNTTTFSGTQPANADTLFADLEITHLGCGGGTGQFISFTPGSSVSLSLTLSTKSPCKYLTSLPKATVDAAFTLQS